MAKQISHEFTYSMPDDYLKDTSTLGLTGTFTYNGPDKFYVFVDQATNKIDVTAGYIKDDISDSNLNQLLELSANNGKDYPVLVDATQEPIIATLMVPQEYDSGTWPQKQYKLDGDDTVYFERPEQTPVDHTYELELITYNKATSSWVKPFPWKKPHIDWNMMNQIIQMNISNIDNDIASGNYSDEEIVTLRAHQDEFRNLTTRFAGWEPWQIPFPEWPFAEPAEPPAEPPAV